MLLQSPNDLLFRKTALAHRRSPRDRLNYQMEGIPGSRSFGVILRGQHSSQASFGLGDADARSLNRLLVHLQTVTRTYHYSEIRWKEISQVFIWRLFVVGLVEL